MIIKDDIFVLKEIKYKDNDKILHAITRNNGKIQIISRGCRKNKSKLMNISQIMSYSRCDLYVSKDMYIINNGETLSSFYYIRNKMNSFLYGTYILEILNYITQENDVNKNLFDMTIKLFNVLNNIEDDSEIVSKLIAIYELKLISMLGYKPQLKKCINCQGELYDDDVYYFNIEEGGVQCHNCVCLKNKGLNITSREILILNRMLMSKLDEEYNKLIDIKLKQLIRQYMFHHIGKSNFVTLKFLN